MKIITNNHYRPVLYWHDLMNNEHGGVKTIIGLGTKKELFNSIHRLLDGIHLEREVA